MGNGLRPDEVEGRMLGLLRDFDKVGPLYSAEATDFERDLGLDRLDVIEVFLAVEEEFSIEIPDRDLEGLRNVRDVVDYVVRREDSR